MTVVVGMTDLMLMGTADDEQKQFLRSVKQAADALLRMLDEAVDYSRLEVSTLELNDSLFSLADVVKQAEEACGRPPAVLRVAVAIEETVPPRLLGDGDRLRQVIEGLFRSAAKFRSGHDYDLRIAAQSAGEGGLLLHFALGEQGRPFDAYLSSDEAGGNFLRLQDFNSRGFSGSGLSLPVSAGLIELMGGELWMADKLSIADRVGSPVLFRFTVRCRLPDGKPSADLLAEVVARLGTTAPKSPSLHVLLVEDTAANRQFYTSVLEQRGHTVVAVANGQQALQAFQSSGASGAFDLLLVDVEMPVMNGPQMAAELRQRDDFKRRPVPVVALTAHRTEGDKDFSRPGLFDAAITKPCELAHFYAVIEALARGEQVAGPRDRREATSDERLDYRGTMRRLGGNQQLFYDLTRFFLEDAPVVLAELGTSLDANDAKRVERAAHSLKGLVANFGAKEATSLAGDLQRCGRNGELNDVSHLFQRLETEVNLLRRELEGHQAKKPN
jgi:CheY-like chemotaxis protein/HPt (histidine-containing phosphotransfer) domain-containing protein